ncbi:MAG: TMEM165/GDT1 family protein [Candidatus Thermoplasmatota archaeon]|nr:TMEM165/GDT1 family protein [Candidatus Thermoplasmatota archaeon]
MTDILEDFLVPLGVIALAELGDKTQVSLLLLTSQTRRRLHLLAGVMLAFFIVDGVAIAAGAWVATVVPERLLRLTSAAVFIAFGAYMLLSPQEKEETSLFRRGAFTSGFLLILATEWGDKTQLAAALFATRFHPWLVLGGTLAALAALSAAAVLLGGLVAEKVDRRSLTLTAGVLFVALGVAFALLP